MVINRVTVLGSGSHTPTKFFWEYPPPPGSVRESRLLDRPHVLFLISSMSDKFENGGELEITEFEIADGK